MQLVHHPLYLALSATVVILGSWTALDLFRRVRAWVGQPRAAWLIASSLAMGLSVWAMHLIALLGFDVGAPMRYDVSLTALSLCVAVGATGLAFAISGGRKPDLGSTILAGVVMGLGVAAMTYVGMAGLRSSAVFGYHPARTAAAVLTAILAGVGAMAAVERVSDNRIRMIGALAIGAAMLAVHYLALSSIRVLPGVDLVGSEEGVGSLGMASAIAAGTVFILFLASVAALFDRRFEQVAAVEAKRSEAQLRAIVDQMPVGIIVYEAPSCEIRFTNPEAEHLLGMRVPRSAPWEWQVDGEGNPRRPESFAIFRALRMGQRTQSERTEFLRPDGRKMIFDVTAAPVFDPDGRIVQGVLTFQDITSKLRAEEALRQSQRMESIGQLTGGVAHDFNNLLTAILGSLTLASRRVEDERARQLIDNANQAARRGARLTEQLLAFSRRQRLETQPVDVNAMIERMGGLFSSTLGGTVKVTFDLGEDLPAALADPAQLELALLNLALNARDAMPGGGELTLATELTALGPPRADCEPGPGRYLAITIEDTGGGMDSATQARAFEPFFTTKPASRGSGLGLSQVLGLAKQLGGGVSIESEMGEGCAVTVYLPVSPEPARPAVSDLAWGSQQPAIAGARVLVVDDDPDVRGFVADLLREAGCSVRTEADGASGLQALDGGPWDLMVLDFAMPGMTGAEVARQTRERYGDIPVLIMTGYLEHEAVLAQLGAQPILQKPFEPAELLSRIAATLKRPQEA